MLVRLRDRHLPIHLTATSRAYIEGLAGAQPEPMRSAFLAVLDSSRSDAAIESIEIEPSLKRQLHAVLRNTVSPTILQAGAQANVIPSLAEVVCDGRILPGQTRQSFLRELHDLFGGDAEIEFITPETSLGPLEAEPSGPLWQTIEQVLRERAPGCAVVPKMLAGATDAKHVARLGAKVYGFAPELYTGPDESARIHGHDERIGVESLKWGAATLCEVVERFCT
jgi:acetylornithine deacetylase/succinyl-diaminopimelate desuccinylase-like protein